MEDAPSSPPPTWATDPLGTIHARIRSAVQARSGDVSHAGAPVLGTLTTDLPPTASLPPLTPTTPVGSLIRLTGMVQDVADPDWWYTRYGPHPGRTTWGLEEVDADTHAELEAETASGGGAGALAQRVGVRFVTPPGLTPWARAAGGGGVLMGAVAVAPAAAAAATAAAPAAATAAAGDPRGGKRKLGDDNAMDEDTPLAAMAGAPEKRPRDGAGGGDGVADGASPPPPLHFPGEELDDPEAAATLGLNLPVAADAATGGMSVLVKVYGADEDGGTPRLHTLQTVVGVVAAGAAGGPPVVHALRVEAAEVGDIHPALPTDVAAAADATSTAADAAAGRAAVVAHLAAALGGDTVAATYLATCLASRVCMRATDSTLPAVLGKLSVNLVLPQEGGGVSYDGIADAVAAVVPRLVRLVADIPHLNAAPWFAVKDYGVNRLRAGPLQTAPGCVLAIDATGLTAGTLNATGVRNVKALAQVASAATVPVVFDYYEAAVDADSPLLVVTRGGKALFSTDAVVHVRPNRGGGRAGDSAALVDLPAARRALALAAVGDGALEISNDLSALVTRTFVEARAAAAEAARSRVERGGGATAAAQTVDGDTLGRWLGLARCLARFRGVRELNPELWEEALRLDRECP
ncbi:hypothetical protein MMPV_004738 [Pyropia vietnamensis]